MVPRLIPEPPAVPGARWIPLTRGYFALIDECDHDRVSRFRWSFHPAGRQQQHFYAVGWVDGKHMLLHHFIMGRRERVDHRNGDGLDNRRQNLRFATRAENQRNASVRADSLTGLKGVTFARDRGYYRAVIMGPDRKRRWLGNFQDPKEAARAYNQAAFTLFGEFARVNKA